MGILEVRIEKNNLRLLHSGEQLLIVSQPGGFGSALAGGSLSGAASLVQIMIDADIATAFKTTSAYRMSTVCYIAWTIIHRICFNPCMY